MSPRPLRPCSQPGCATLVASGRCPEHTQRREHEPAARAFYNSTRWKKIRAIVRAQQPVCQECKARPSQTVDHLNGIDDNRLEALQALCWACHNAKSGREHRAKHR